jgi:hypothetical protein
MNRALALLLFAFLIYCSRSSGGELASTSRDGVDRLRPFVVTAIAFIGHVEGLSFDGNLFVCNPDREYHPFVRFAQYDDIVNDIFGAMLVLDDRLALDPQSKALSTCRTSAQELPQGNPLTA